MRRVSWAMFVFAAMGCSGDEPTFRATGGTQAATAPTAPPFDLATIPDHQRPARVGAGGERVYGRELVAGVREIALSALSEGGSQFDGQTVRTEGMIARVCTRMGCWMELQAEGVAPVRVPLAGHNYFLPQAERGRVATVEGVVRVEALTEDVRRHLESEGATATATALSIEASSVVVR